MIKMRNLEVTEEVLVTGVAGVTGHQTLDTKTPASKERHDGQGRCVKPAFAFTQTNVCGERLREMRGEESSVVVVVVVLVAMDFFAL
ncbi:hypothetical protein Pmani_026866 [Petrolisthes manimaculis]|uniref:Uncharacterized protein n=1 Tax=Petrolisthes manimaculis TaxID=1843537 RepID=A0AAE1P4C3_9EUCA|nr:hypothetical protein Pmani_026866 [Petrolisthes manimaculis]